MKMEGDFNKLSSAKTSDTGGLTFGPAWLRQLSSGETNKTALPPSPGLPFKLAKHRYSREEMLAIYETIEKSLSQSPPPPNLEEFEDLLKRDLHRPVLLSPPSLEEQKFLSTCVNSQVVLNSYNKVQGQVGGSGSGGGGGGGGGGPSANSNSSSGGNREGRESTSSNPSSSSRGGSNSVRGSRGGGGGGGGGRGGLNVGSGERGGRGRGRGRATEFKTIDEENSAASSTVSSSTSGRGGASVGAKGPYKNTYSRQNWEERESNSGPSGKKEFSRFSAGEDNWRNKAAAVAAAAENDAQVEKPTGAEESQGTTTPASSASSSAAAEPKQNNETVSKTNSTGTNEPTTTTTKPTNNQKTDNSNENYNNPSTQNEKSNKKEKPLTTGGNSVSTASSSRDGPKKYSDNLKSSSNNKNSISESRQPQQQQQQQQQHQQQRQSVDNRHRPEWLNDDDDVKSMTFDESGEFVPVKELRQERKEEASEAEKKVVELTVVEQLQKQVDPITTNKKEPECEIKTKPNEIKPEQTQTDTQTKPVLTSPPKQQQQQQQQADTASKLTPNETPDEVKLAANILGLIENETQLLRNKITDPAQFLSQLKISNPDLLNAVQQQLKLKQQQQQQQQQQGQFQLDENLNITNQKLNKLPMNESLSNPTADQLLLATTALNATFLNKSLFNNAAASNLAENLPNLHLKNEFLLNLDAKRGAVSLEHPDAERWFYLDPQNQIQGSFSSEQMAGWFAAGYFTMNLMIKRGCDEKFLPLGVVSSNWGRIPFTSGPQPQPQITQPSQQQQQLQQQQLPQQQQQQWSKEQLLQQFQLIQRLQQMPLVPQNLNLLRNELSGIQQNTNISNLGNLLQQLQQLQAQQNALSAAASTMDPVAVSSHVQDIRTQQENLINQLLLNNANNNQLSKAQLHQHLAASSLPDLDPAILGAAPANVGSIWGDLNSNSISPIKTLLQQQQQQSSGHSSSSATPIDPMMLNANTASLVHQLHSLQSQNHASNLLNNGNLNAMQQMLNDNHIKDKIQLLFEQTKKEEERRRKHEEMQMRLKREEEEKRRLLMEEMRAKEEELKRLQEEERIREELRKEQQRKKLEEIIKKQEEEKRKNDEGKKKKEEEKRLKEEKLKQKQKEELEKMRLQQQSEEAEKRRQQEQQAELLRKQLEAEKQKQKLQQEQLNNLQLPAHANWAKNQQQLQQQQPALQLKSILEQQALESMQQRLIEQQKQAEMMSIQQGSQSTWSSLFRGNSAQASNPTTTTNNNNSSNTGNTVSLASIQSEQNKETINTTANTTSTTTTNKPPPQQQQQQQQQKQQVSTPVNKQVQPQQQQPPPPQQQQQTSKQQSTTWAAWGNQGKPTDVANLSNNPGGFWSDLNENHSQNNNNNKKPQANKHSNGKTKNHEEFNHDKVINSKQAKKVAAIEESIQASFRNMTISDEFMKWCHEQLKDFDAGLHIPTFVNFLREIESCAEIEDYVVNYLGDSKQAKDFAQQFYVNRESQLRQQNNYHPDDQHVDDSNYKESQFSKKNQKKRSKGQRVDHQLLGFTVQPDPNLKNRGDIESL